MTRFADPYLCPDCRTRLPQTPTSCPSCGLPLGGPLASQLLATLQSADQLLVQLRASAVTRPAEVPSPATTEPHFPIEPYPASSTAPPPRRGLHALSVPTILLSLGALCLLVAAVIFLAVAWSWLGVGGRTAVLVALTLASGGVGTWLGRRGLRLAAESLTVVGFGLLGLDVVGADNAGWLGALTAAGLTTSIGAALAVAALALALLTPARLVAPQVVAAAGLWLTAVGAASATGHDQLVAALAVLALGALAWLGRARNLTVLPWAAVAGAATWWGWLALSGLADAADHASLRGMWVDGHGVALLAATALLVLPAAFAPSRPTVVRAAGTATASLATLTLALPALDESGTRIALVSLAFLALWSAATVLTPRRWSVVPIAPLCLTALPVTVLALGLAEAAAANVLDAGEPFTRGVGMLLPTTDAPAHPALLVPLVAGLLLAAAAAAKESRGLARVIAPTTLALAATGTLALYPVPLWTVVAALCLVAGALVFDALEKADARGAAQAGVGGVVAAAALVAALPSDWLTTGVLALVVAGAALSIARGRFPSAGVTGALTLPAATAGLIWSTAEVAGFDTAYRAAPVLLVVGLMAILRPRIELESSAAMAAGVVSGLAIPAASDVPGSLALHLTLAGALVSASSLVNPSRRLLGWLGGLLLAAATWVRLADLGVEVPEAYTLPSAIVLVLVGVRHLSRDPSASTRRALTAGLVLATTPSLLQVLAEDPVSLRAGLLGAGCLALVLAGTIGRWGAPLMVGAAVGGVLVLRELAPYAAATPPWVLIGLAGTLLTVVGVTWESRMRDVRTATAYLGRLR